MYFCKKYFVMSNSLFKYYSPKEYNLEAVREGFFFFSRLDQLNDPFENVYLRMRDTDFMKEHDKSSPSELLHNKIKQYATCSFSRCGKNKHQWALYADSYKGFVVEYDREVLKRFCETFPDELFLGEVEYVDNKNLCDENKELDIEQATNLSYIEDVVTERIFQKEKESWASEEEERLFFKYIRNLDKVHKVKGKGYKIPWGGSCPIKSLIVGHNCDCSDVKSLLDIAKKYNIPLKHTIVGKSFEIQWCDFPKHLDLLERITLRDLVKVIQPKL